MGNDWEDLDTEKLLRKNREQREQTTSGGVGGYERPLGGPLRPAVPVPPYEPVETLKKKKAKKR